MKRGSEVLMVDHHQASFRDADKARRGGHLECTTAIHAYLQVGCPPESLPVAQRSERAARV
ncbi:MAG: hypothetical protein HY319_26915 [Armatimonadetes bacterium]|nr:hypothetical protein [Armatimonadota bacterium]